MAAPPLGRVRLIFLLPGNGHSSKMSPVNHVAANLPDQLRGDAPVRPKVSSLQPRVIALRPEMASQPMSNFAVSARLGKLLGYLEVQVLGDLQGRSFVELAAYRNIGRVTICELWHLLRPFFAPPTPAESGSDAPPPSHPNQCRASRQPRRTRK